MRRNLRTRGEKCLRRETIRGRGMKFNALLV
jgi:hypothetical protein